MWTGRAARLRSWKERDRPVRQSDGEAAGTDISEDVAGRSGEPLKEGLLGAATAVGNDQLARRQIFDQRAAGQGVTVGADTADRPHVENRKAEPSGNRRADHLIAAGSSRHERERTDEPPILRRCGPDAASFDADRRRHARGLRGVAPLASTTRHCRPIGTSFFSACLPCQRHQLPLRTACRHLHSLPPHRRQPHLLEVRPEKVLLGAVSLVPGAPFALDDSGIIAHLGIQPVIPLMLRVTRRWRA